MAGKYFILQKVTDFAPGYFENATMEAGCVQLGREMPGYTASGTYTSPPYACEGFFDLIPSWNADTPPGTTVEMQARVSANGRWSHWLSFGTWSPYINRASQPLQQDEIAQVEKEVLSVKEGCPAADMVQLRVILHTTNLMVTPRVHLLAVSTNAASKMEKGPPAFGRTLPLPRYSARTRDPAIADAIISVTSLVMMMNRWGTDLLPEEVARSSYDTTAGDFSNFSFLCAISGCFGFSCQVGYTGIAALRRAVWLGNPIAARVRYRAQALGEQEPDNMGEDDAGLPPLIAGASYSSKGHLVVVHGFSRENGPEVVTYSDPAMENVDMVLQTVPVSTFAKMYTGISIFLQPGPEDAGKDAPKRKLGHLVVEKNTLRLLEGGEEIVPAKLDSVSLSPCTICYTLSDGIAYASAAQRQFYYPKRDETGVLRFDRAAAAGRRMTFYVFGIAGRNWVAERLIEPETPPTPKAPDTAAPAATDAPL